MIPNRDELTNAKYRDYIDINCDHCGISFERMKRSIMTGGDTHYCTSQCFANYKSMLAKESKKDIFEKSCSMCGEIKSLESFNKNKTKPDGYNTMCRVCSNIRSRQYYKENPIEHKIAVQERNKRVRMENMRSIFNYYLDNPCIDCGEANPVILDSDHRDVDTKFKNISEMVGESYSWKRIIEELNKCETRCANCHRKRTAKQFNWYKGMPDIEKYLK